MSPAVLDIVRTACVIAIGLTAYFVVGSACGWVTWSVSLKSVPPWNRRASEKKPTTAAEPAGTEAQESAFDAALRRKAS